jgi:hypothetical protein
MQKLKLAPTLLLSVASLFALPLLAYAATDSDSTVVNSSLGSTISMSTDGTVNVNLTPTASGSMSSDSDTVLVSTNNSSGYALTLSDANTDTNLINGSNNIAADAGTQASPSSTLTNNRWGYRVDGVGGFGAGPTSAESNVSSSSYKWAGVPSSASPNTLKTTSSTATDDSTTVWFGVKADTSNPNGTYTDTVTYTATTN